MGVKGHKAAAPQTVRVGIISMSTTRSLSEDESGQWMREQAIGQGHAVIFHELVPDDADKILQTIQTQLEKHPPQILLLNGGTGIGPTDVTIEAVRTLFDKELAAFGPLFAYLSFKEIGSAAILSRATAGVIGETAVFCLPGSLKACKLACNSLIFPEFGHIAKHVGEK